MQFAALDDYCKWLKGFLHKDGRPTHFFDYPFSLYPNFLKATASGFVESPVTTNPTFIIVPRLYNVQVKGSAILLLHNDFAAIACGQIISMVPIFDDQVFKRSKLLANFWAQQKV